MFEYMARQTYFIFLYIKAFIHITGFLKPEEEKDIIKSKEESEDFMSHNISEIKHLNKL